MSDHLPTVDAPYYDSPDDPLCLLPAVAKRHSSDDAIGAPDVKRPKSEDQEVLYFQEDEEDAGTQEKTVDFAMELLAREHERHHLPTEPSLEFQVSPLRESIGIKSSEFTCQVCATVKACELPGGDSFARSPVDIVVALDVSGSMRVEKLDLCKKTLHLLLRELHQEDRFGLISFSEEAKIEVPMQKVNEENKRMALRAIDRLSVRGLTNIASAISLSAQMVNAVTSPNKVRSVFLLTDGNANSGFTEAADLLKLTSIFVEEGHNPHTPPVTLHTFGYGPEPDQKLLRGMAKVTYGGSFYSVPDNSHVMSAFGDAVGGILSVVAQNVLLTITAEKGAGIVQVYHDKAEQLSDGVFQLPLGDLYAEESRDIVFEVTLISPTTMKNGSSSAHLFPHAIVQLSYNDTLNHSRIGPVSLPALIARPNDRELSWPNRYVTIQWLRVRTVRVIGRAEKLSKDGEVDLAKTEIINWIEEFHKESFEVGAQEDALVVQLLSDLTECLDILKRKDYNAYAENELGVKMNTHYFQRCSEPIISGKQNVYRTGQKSFRAQAFKRGSGSGSTLKR
ncbi:hypothetical protein HJC23_004002 [Cyclotella cryptica]|uniref:VWFA domain-containing protein n=1 Tax=Cyclotella cryptica TaxID=29204 RepID=A0ABD3QUC5_9STRA